MGQIFGRASSPKIGKNFVNLPKKCIFDIWEAYNDIAEGYGLRIHEFYDILKTALASHLKIEDPVLLKECDALFRLYDNDKNNLVDSLEFISSLAVISGMSLEEKCLFLFAMFDFSESDQLKIEEIILAFRSALSGVAKLFEIEPPSEEDLQQIVFKEFEAADEVNINSSDLKMDKQTFLYFCMNTPEVYAWFEYFDDPYECEIDYEVQFLHDSDTISEIPSKGILTPQQLYEGSNTTREKMAWENVVPALVNSRISNDLPLPPSENVQMEWIYGYNGLTSRQNVYYSHTGEVVYPAGAVAVIYNIYRHSQRYFTQHHGYITCLKLFHSKDGDSTIIATGERSPNPVIHVWDFETRTIFSTLNDFHVNAILCLDFSPDRTKLVSIGDDKYHSVAVYNWQQRERLFSLRSTALEVFDVKYLTDAMFASCGKNHVYFWKRIKDNVYKKYRGIFEPVIPDTQLCIGVISGHVVTGSSSGLLRVWEGRNLVKTIQAHKGAVQSLYTVEQGVDSALMTGCSSGKIMIWNSKLEISGAFDTDTIVSDMLSSYGPEKNILEGSQRANIDWKSSSIVGICWHLISSRILVSFKNSMIIEIHAIDGQSCRKDPIACGHSNHRIAGLSVHPFMPNTIASVGDDEVIRIFNIKDKRLSNAKYLGANGNCCAYSPNGQLILIGIGYDKSFQYTEQQLTRLRRKEGIHLILSEDDLSVVHENQDSKYSITDCKFSPNGETYVLSSIDSFIYVHKTSTFRTIAICRGHSASVIHIDISVDNQFIMSNDSQGQLIFWDLFKGEAVSAKTVRDITWNTNTCVYSYCTSKIWSRVPEEFNYNQTNRSNSQSLLICATNNGEIRLYQAPCLKESSPYRVLYGHANSVLNSVFTCDDNRIITSGGQDGVIVQWSMIPGSRLNAELVDQMNNVSISNTRKFSDELLSEILFEGENLDKSKTFYEVLNDIPFALFDYEEMKIHGTDASLSEKKQSKMPWQRSIVPPSHIPREDSSEPSDALDIEYIHGITVDRSRSSIQYSPTGEAIYFVGSIAVIMNQKQRTQRYYQAHKTTITALAVYNPEQRLKSSSKTFPKTELWGLVATGDMSDHPVIRVWDPITLLSYAKLYGYHIRAIIHLEFDQSGTKLLSVGQDSFHSIAVYDWRNSQIIHRCNSFINKSFFASFSPSGDSIIHGGFGIIRMYDLYGLNQSFVDVLSGSSRRSFGSLGLVDKTATTESSPDSLESILIGQGYLCCLWIDESTLFIGSTDGKLIRLIGKHVDGVVSAHDGSVNSVCATDDGLCTGSADGTIKFWILSKDMSLECRLTINISIFRSTSMVVQTLTTFIRSKQIMFVTTHAELYEISSQTGQSIHQFISHDGSTRNETFAILEGHGGDELWGFSPNPVKEEYCTVGDDAVLRYWDMNTHQCFRSIPIEMPARSCCYSIDGKLLVIGFGSPRKLTPRQYDGKWSVMDTSNNTMTHEARDCKSWITDIKFSPSGEFLAMAGYDNKIYVYNTLNAYSLSSVIQHHQSYITAFDFSEDGAWIQANTKDLELDFFETDTGIHIPAPSRLKDVSWSTQHCYMSWAVQGIWKPYQDGSQPVVCDSNFAQRDNIPIESILSTVDDKKNEVPVVITGDDYGRISVYRYPCLNSLSHCKKYRVSSNAITRLRIIGGSNPNKPSGLVTIIGKDKAIIQWKHRRDGSIKIASNVLSRRGVIEEEEDDVIKYFERFLTYTKLDLRKDLNQLSNSRELLFPKSLHLDGNDSRKNSDYTLQLVHAIGIQSQLSRNSVYYSSNSPGKCDSIVFPTSRYVCILNIASHIESVYCGHVYEVSCVAVSVDRMLVASAEKSLRPRIHVWDASTCLNLKIFNPFHRKGIISMQFSEDRRFLVSIGVDIDHSIALWESSSGNWRDGFIRATSMGDMNPVLFCNFMLTIGSSYVLASGGRFHVKFWKLNGRCLNPEYPELPESIKLGTQLSGCLITAQSTATIMKYYLTGTTSGHLFIWKGRKFEKALKAHEGGITVIRSTPFGVITGSKDGQIKIWNANVDGLNHMRTINIKSAVISPLDCIIRSIDMHGTVSEKGINRLLIGTSGSEIYEISYHSDAIDTMIESHFTGELWGLATNPVNPDLFVTSGDDKTIRLWSIRERRIICKAVLDCTSRCIDWSKDGQLILLGMGGQINQRKQRKDGAFIVLNGETLQPIYEGRDSKQWITCVRISPNNHILAIATSDGNVYCYDSIYYKCKGKTNIESANVIKENSFPEMRKELFIAAMDFTNDSVYLRCDVIVKVNEQMKRYEVILESEDATIVNSSLEFNHWNNPLCLTDLDMKGVWMHPEDMSFGEPSAVHVSMNKKVVCVGDEYGDLRVYSYPCKIPIPSQSLTPLAQSTFNPRTVQPLLHIPRAHVGIIGQIRFSSDDQYLITIGRQDRSILIWKIHQLMKSDSINI